MLRRIEIRKPKLCPHGQTTFGFDRYFVWPNVPLTAHSPWYTIGRNKLILCQKRGRLTCIETRCCLVLFSLLIPATLLAQGVQATLRGRVADSSGASMATVKVEVKNTGTNQIVTTVTDTARQYTVPFLNPGSYSVTIEAAGFKKFVRENLVLSIGNMIDVDRYSSTSRP